MKIIYIYEKDLSGFQTFPVPKDLSKFHVVEVEDDFIMAGKIYDPSSKSFKEKPVSFEDHKQEQNQIRNRILNAGFETSVNSIRLKATKQDVFNLSKELDFVKRSSDEYFPVRDLANDMHEVTADQFEQIYNDVYKFNRDQNLNYWTAIDSFQG